MEQTTKEGAKIKAIISAENAQIEIEGRFQKHNLNIKNGEKETVHFLNHEFKFNFSEEKLKVETVNEWKEKESFVFESVKEDKKKK